MFEVLQRRGIPGVGDAAPRSVVVCCVWEQGWSGSSEQPVLEGYYGATRRVFRTPSVQARFKGSRSDWACSGRLRGSGITFTCEVYCQWCVPTDASASRTCANGRKRYLAIECRGEDNDCRLCWTSNEADSGSCYCSPCSARDLSGFAVRGATCAWSVEAHVPCTQTRQVLGKAFVEATPFCSRLRSEPPSFTPYQAPLSPQTRSLYCYVV